jgi:2-dehydro-3-deoxyphosphogluconate aldolase/(4S)-4-hydroxy-2-oxoglutarate aldolase
VSGAFDREKFEGCPIVGILRGFDAALVGEMVRAARRGGLLNLEVTMNSPQAQESIHAALDEGAGEINVGAGTVCTRSDLEGALAAGAGFIVTPVLVPEIIQACRGRGVPVIAGAFTPTEIYAAWTQGADLVKVFPANQLGPGYIRDVKAPLPSIRLMPTGGVDAETLPAFRAAGADAFGVGSALFSSARAKARDWQGIEREARRLVDAYRAGV